MASEVIKLCGLKRTEVEERLAQFSLDGLTFDVREENLDCRVKLIFKGKEQNEFAMLKSRICNAFADNIYASVDIPLNHYAAELLMRSKHVLSTAESLTGGAVSSSLIECSGISSHFFEGIVCYNSDSKAERLGVSRSTLQSFGAVSKATAVEMVRGLLNNPHTTLGVSTTGLAGPTADEGKPVGLVYIAVGSGDFITVFEHKFDGERNEIRMKAKNLALFYLVRFLQGNILML